MKQKVNPITIFLIVLNIAIPCVSQKEYDKCIIYFKLYTLSVFEPPCAFNSNAIRIQGYDIKIESKANLNEISNVFLNREQDNPVCNPCDDYIFEKLEPVIIVDFIYRDKIIESVSIMRIGDYIRNDGKNYELYKRNDIMIDWFKKNISQSLVLHALQGYKIEE